MTALWRLSAAQLAAGYRQRQFTPVDVVDACLARTDLCQPLLNAMVCTDHTGARLAAQASQRRWAAGQALGALDGVPISIKDNLHQAGLPTSWGSRLLQGFVAQHDELPVARLRAAGAVLIGKSNLPEFAMQGTTDNLVCGPSRNPWQPALTPGGSSGGAAAGVAAGCGPLALATDGGGSIRRPASHCGLLGFKPSAGLVPRQGGLPEIFLDHEVVGGIARSVADLRSLLGVLTQQHRPAVAVPRLRILYMPRFGSHPVDAAIARQVQQAAARLQALGHAVDEAPAWDGAEAINALWPALSAAGLAWMLARASAWPEFGLLPGQTVDSSSCGAAAQAALAQGLAGSALPLFDLLHQIQQLQRALARLFSQHDVLLTPATAALPWPVAQSHPEQIAGQAVGPRGHAVFTAFANAAGLPALAVPSGLVQGLPTGFQLVGAPGTDTLLLDLAQQYELAHPWAQHWPLQPAGSEA